jgi:peptidyl-tRNA hydrolase, PTH1 family
LADRWLVVGLGNPGPRYAATRHNAGALVVDEIAERVGGSFKTHRSRTEILEGRFAGVPVVLAKPLAYMNESGGPVVNAARFFKVGVERIVLVHDDLDLPFGAVRLKRGGGEGGHNGLRSA